MKIILKEWLLIGVFTVRFGSVFIKKTNQTGFFKKKTETGSNRPVSVWFSSVRFFREKTGSNRFGSVFSVWLGFSGLAQFFGLARFFSGFFSVRFGSVFPVPDLKNRTEPVGFFKILIGVIGFFSRFGFFGYLFSGFLGLIGFSVFLNTPSC
jgi:hypothetical protein